MFYNHGEGRSFTMIVEFERHLRYERTGDSDRDGHQIRPGGRIRQKTCDPDL